MQQNIGQVSHSSSRAQDDDDEIDLMRLVGQLLENKWLIIAVTALFTLGGIAYALLATPIYKADALLQVEKKSSGMPALGEMGDLFSSDSDAATEIQIIKSRMRSEEHTSELQSRPHLVCRLLLEKKKKKNI